MIHTLYFATMKQSRPREQNEADGIGAAALRKEDEAGVERDM